MLANLASTFYCESNRNLQWHTAYKLYGSLGRQRGALAPGLGLVNINGGRTLSKALEHFWLNLLYAVYRGNCGR